MFNIVLLEPRMPGNVGTVGRLAYALDCTLHLIKPYGFGDISEKQVRRAGLDYWFKLDVREYDNIEQFWLKNPLSERHFFATTKTKQTYFDASFKPNDYLYFGREDDGLPQDLLARNEQGCITIPMANQARSLNMANAVSVVAYEALRQNFASFESDA